MTGLRALAIVLLGTLTWSSCAVRETSRVPERLAQRPEPVEIDGVRTLGRSFIRQREGIREARFAGAPYERGYARGRLGHGDLAGAEKDLQSLLERLVPGRFKRWALHALLDWTMRRSRKWIPTEHLDEIAGLADADFPDPLPKEGNRYARHLALHAMHDFSQRFIDTIPLSAACSGFAAGPPATSDGHVYLARNFDFEASPRFDREKIVAAIVPDSGHAYLSVTFGGLTGAVSGVNDAGLAVSLQALTGGPTAGAGEPSSLIVADVLEHDATVEQAIERIRSSRVLVSDIYVLADASGALAVVEKTPKAAGVRRSRPWIAATNHAETAEVSRVTGPSPALSTSVYRRRRLNELLTASAGRLDARRAVQILRDRKGIGGVSLGPGNRNAIDALIACHSVVFDVTARRAYVAAYPHTLGAYAVFDLSILATTPAGETDSLSPHSASIPADAFLVSGEYARYRQARRLNARARAELRHGRSEDAERDASAALALAPDLLDALVCRGEARNRVGRDGRSDLDAALALSPGPPDFAAQIRRARRMGARAPLVSFPLSANDLVGENESP